MNNIFIIICIRRITKLLIPIDKCFVSLPVLIQNKQTQEFTEQTLCNAFVQAIVRVGYHIASALFLKQFSQERKILNSKNNKFEVCKFQRIKNSIHL